MLALPVRRRSIARFLLMVFSLMLVNGIVFRHAHKLPSGRIIAHAHPYWPIGKSPYQPNTHTTHELLWLDTLTHLVYESPAVLAVGFAVQVAAAVVAFGRPAGASPRPAACFPALRGPPPTR